MSARGAVQQASVRTALVTWGDRLTFVFAGALFTDRAATAQGAAISARQSLISVLKHSDRNQPDVVAARSASAEPAKPWLNLYLTLLARRMDHGAVRRVLLSMTAVFGAALVALASAPPVSRKVRGSRQVGNATQVLSVVGTGGSDAKMDVWQRTAAGWQPVEARHRGQDRLQGHVAGSHRRLDAHPDGLLQLGLRFRHRRRTPAAGCRTFRSPRTTGGTAI